MAYPFKPEDTYALCASLLANCWPGGAEMDVTSKSAPSLMWMVVMVGILWCQILLRSSVGSWGKKQKVDEDILFFGVGFCRIVCSGEVNRGLEAKDQLRGDFPPFKHFTEQ
jgi:hypothetical protein